MQAQPPDRTTSAARCRLTRSGPCDARPTVDGAMAVDLLVREGLAVAETLFDGPQSDCPVCAAKEHLTAA